MTVMNRYEAIWIGCPISDFLKSDCTSSKCSSYSMVLCGCVQDGWTALHLAARGGHTCAVETLVEAGANVNAAGGVVSCS